jgi:cold shock CspA family protein
MNQKLHLHSQSTGGRHDSMRVQGEPPRPRGLATTGRIVKLLMGHGHGFIRLTDGREVFFHRGDLLAGARLLDLNVGDRVAFEIIEDRVSGARALQVRPHSR